MKIECSRICCGNRGNFRLFSHRGDFLFGYWESADGSITVNIDEKAFITIAKRLALASGQDAVYTVWEKVAMECRYTYG